MGKDGDLWDDSALIDAFDQAMSKYKVMHKTANSGCSSKEEVTSNNRDEESSGKSVLCTGPVSSTEILHNQLGGALDADSEVPGNLHGQESCTSEQLPEVPPAQEKLDDFSCTKDTEYDQLLSQYHELEEQHQKVLQQLQQMNYWNYQSPSQYPTTEVPQGANFNNSYSGLLPSSCLPGGQIFCQPGYSPTMYCNSSAYCNLGAVENACWSMSHAHQEPTEKESGKEEATGKCESSQTAKNSMDTDLSVVLNAWYSAGFYTGRYLMQWSLKKDQQH